MDQELLSLLEHLSSPPVFTGVHVPPALALCVVFCRSLFVLFALDIVLSVLLFTDSDYLHTLFTQGQSTGSYQGLFWRSNYLCVEPNIDFKLQSILERYALIKHMCSRNC